MATLCIAHDLTWTPVMLFNFFEDRFAEQRFSPERVPYPESVLPVNYRAELGERLQDPERKNFGEHTNLTASVSTL